MWLYVGEEKPPGQWKKPASEKATVLGTGPVDQQLTQTHEAATGGRRRSSPNSGQSLNSCGSAYLGLCWGSLFYIG